MWVEQESYRESGAGVGDLAVDGADAQALRLSGLVAVTREFPVTVGGKVGTLVPELRLGVVHEVALDNRTVNVALPGFGSFTVSGNDDDETGAALGVGATLSLRDNVSALIDYEGQFGSNTDNHYLKGRLRIIF